MSSEAGCQQNSLGERNCLTCGPNLKVLPVIMRDVVVLHGLFVFYKLHFYAKFPIEWQSDAMMHCVSSQMLRVGLHNLAQPRVVHVL